MLCCAVPVVAPRLLSLSRHSGGSFTSLGSFDLHQRDNGLVDGAWNMVRVLLVTTSGSTEVKVWVNPAAPDTGLVGNPSVDMGLTFTPPPPLLQASDRLGGETAMAMAMAMAMASGCCWACATVPPVSGWRRVGLLWCGGRCAPPACARLSGTHPLPLPMCFPPPLPLGRLPSSPLPAGGLALFATGASWNVDYVSALPPSVL